MTGPTRRELKQRVADLRESGGGRPGFHRFKIGGELEPEKTGYYEWDDDRGEYVNEHGHTISADAAPDRGEDFNGNPIDPDNHGADTLIRYRSVIVMERERAKKEGREILGPYEDAPESRDLVELPTDRIESDDFPNRGGAQ